MAKRKQKDYLDALNDPLLPPDRRWALRLMSMVRTIETIGDSFLPPANVEQEALKLADKLECVNCQKKVQRATLYCGEYCQQMAGIIRYIRKAIAEDRIKKKDIQEGIGITLMMLVDGGYPKEERRVSKEQRQAIFERDNYKCQRCGAVADQIDHINGHSDDPSNLQALCADCNRTKAFENTRPATPEETKRIEKMLGDMGLRIAALMPSKACDDYMQWKKLQGPMMGARKKRFRELEKEAENDFEDVDGYLQNAMEKDD